MRFVTYLSGDQPTPGLRVGKDRILDLAAAFPFAIEQGWLRYDGPLPQDLLTLIAGGPAALEAAKTLHRLAGDGKLDKLTVAAHEAKLLAPIPRPSKNVFCVGRNYAEHVYEGNRAQKIDDALPDYPIWFSKPPTAVIGPDAAIVIDHAISDKIDYEVELGVILGRKGRDIPASRAHDYIFGYTIINDITARDVQRRHKQFLKGKGLDTSCPMGPEIVTRDEVPDDGNLFVRTTVNGELRQDGNTRDMIFPVATLIESLSAGMTLEPGDVIATGTPSGVGYAMEPPCFLRYGDVVSMEVEGIGTLTNRLVDPREAAKETAPALQAAAG